MDEGGLVACHRYVPDYLTLPVGWFGLIFKSPEDDELILNQFWDYEGGNIMLKRWRTCFDPATEFFSFRHVWVLLPGLPLNLWNKNALMAIGNLLGHFLKVDEASLVHQINAWRGCWLSWIHSRV
jgi:hypothetical protein